MAKKLTKAQIKDINFQYLPRLTVNNADAYLQKSAARSARLRKKIACQIDVPYGDTPGQMLDIFPAARKGAPVHVFIHGGYWRALDKDIYSHIAAPMVAAGVALGKVHVLENLGVKVGDVEGAIRPQGHGHRPKKRIVASQQMSVGFDLIDGPVRFQGVPGGASFPDAMIDEEAALNSGRKVRAEQKLAARCDVSAGVEGEVIGSMLGLGISEVRGKYIHRIILPGRGVEHDATSPAVEQVAERVPKTVRHVDPEPVSLRPVTKHRRVTHAARPVRRLDLCVVKNALREIQCPTRTPPEIVHRVFRILSTKAMKQHLHPV